MQFLKILIQTYLPILEDLKKYNKNINKQQQEELSNVSFFFFFKYYFRFYSTKKQNTELIDLNQSETMQEKEVKSRTQLMHQYKNSIQCIKKLKKQILKQNLNNFWIFPKVLQNKIFHIYPQIQYGGIKIILQNKSHTKSNADQNKIFYKHLYKFQKASILQSQIILVFSCVNNKSIFRLHKFYYIFQAPNQLCNKIILYFTFIIQKIHHVFTEFFAYYFSHTIQNVTQYLVSDDQTTLKNIPKEHDFLQLILQNIFVTRFFYYAQKFFTTHRNLPKRTLLIYFQKTQNKIKLQQQFYPSYAQTDHTLNSVSSQRILYTVTVNIPYKKTMKIYINFKLPTNRTDSDQET
eukprot:TRINITY_DN14455_c0_g2_i2.p1 TRINITY_DN14455_c0_g2~~TRINITY_DN14455_c0_g2_i2.p1  ORF type:complete len:349 (+),score=-17.41 TRINITY_DN14455_c0_g2_i2:980-2026(+)